MSSGLTKRNLPGEGGAFGLLPPIVNELTIMEQYTVTDRQNHRGCAGYLFSNKPLKLDYK